MCWPNTPRSCSPPPHLPSLTLSPQRSPTRRPGTRRRCCDSLTAKSAALDRADGPIIGMTAGPGTAETDPYPPGSQLVMYTDGLVERRNRLYYVGVEQAANHLATLREHLSPSQLLDLLLDTLVGNTAIEDDVAVLVMERSLA